MYIYSPPPPFSPPFSFLNRCLHLTNRNTDWTDAAGSALDYLEDLGSSFISISDSQSSYPAHSLLMQAFHSTDMEPYVHRNGTLLPQLSQDKTWTLTIKSSSCVCVPFLPSWWTEFQSDCSAFNLCVVTGIQCLFGILSGGEFYKRVPIWRERFRSAWEHKGSREPSHL